MGRRNAPPSGGSLVRINHVESVCKRFVYGIMQIQRTVTILLPDDADLKATIAAFRGVQQVVSPIAFCNGKPMSAMKLHRACYQDVKGTLNSQMTITALRLVVGAYTSSLSNRKRRLKKEAKRKARHLARGWNYKPRQIRPLGLCDFKNPMAMFLVGNRGRDAGFHKDGVVSIWTLAGRKHIAYTVPDNFRPMFDSAVEIDSVTVIERGGKLLGRVALTREILAPANISPVGIDLNETNALVAVDAGGRELFITGHATKVRNRRTADVVGRIQKKLATHKARKHDTRSVRRVLKRLGRRRSRRTQDFARVAAKTLCRWAPQDAVLVFEDLQMQQPEKGLTRGARLRQRLSLWQHGAIRDAVTNKAQLMGLGVTFVDPAYTSKNCSRCGLRGVRKRHSFVCPHCSHWQHADINAATNIRSKFVQLRLDGALSIAPEALIV